MWLAGKSCSILTGGETKKMQLMRVGEKEKKGVLKREIEMR